MDIQREAVQHHIVLFAHLADCGHHNRLAALFTVDGVLDHGDQPICGRERIDRYFTSFSNTMNTSHNLSNFIVEVDGPNARCQSRCIAWHWSVPAADGSADEPSPADFVTVGGYQDDLRLEDGNWLIARRRILSFGSGLGAGRISPAIAPLIRSLQGRLPDWP